jgi:hypothetical protein
MKSEIFTASDGQPGIRLTEVTQADWDALTAQVAELQERDQRWVDQVCHYRNLAIMLGAKPEQMLSGHDRHLATKWGDPSMHDGDWTMDDELAEVAECWEKLEAAEAENANLREVLERIDASGNALLARACLAEIRGER